MYKYPFEKLQVWHLSETLAIEIYTLTKAFPSTEKYGIFSQLRRASISIASNIAEGSSRATNKDQSHFLNMAYTSLMEVLSLLYLSNSLKLMELKKLESIKTIVYELSNKLNALRKIKNAN